MAGFHPFLCASGGGRTVQPAIHHYRHAREGVFAIKVFDAFTGLELFHEANRPSVRFGLCFIVCVCMCDFLLLRLLFRRID